MGIILMRGRAVAPGIWVLSAILWSAPVAAQAPHYQEPAPYPPQPYGPPAGQGPYGQAPASGYPQQGYGQQAPPGYQIVPTPHRAREPVEIGVLYGTSIGYGIGLGIWLDAEIGISDPAVALIPPAILGISAPVGVYFLDQPRMARGMPAAIAAGLALGAGEGLGIAGLQFVSAAEEDAWGFRGLSRSVALGATIGGAAGWVVGYYDEPSPKLSAFVSSGAFWGTAVGASFGYGVSEGGVGYGEANDSAALGGLIGFNVGMLATAGLSTVFVPTWGQLAWMWGGAGIGAAVSLPVFLFYAGEDAPPAKRGLVFTGTAITLGIAAGGIFSSGDVDIAGRGSPEAESGTGIAYVVPMHVDGGAGVQVGGFIE